MWLAKSQPYFTLVLEVGGQRLSSCHQTHEPQLLKWSGLEVFCGTCFEDKINTKKRGKCSGLNVQWKRFRQTWPWGKTGSGRHRNAGTWQDWVRDRRHALSHAWNMFLCRKKDLGTKAKRSCICSFLFVLFRTHSAKLLGFTVCMFQKMPSRVTEGQVGWSMHLVSLE